ncbi:MAG: hypothetical protein KC766_12925 [Myxococcales bacterium]|nr:hypothetical protein [Myxococcales bacterium]
MQPVTLQESQCRRFPTLPVEEIVLWLWADVRYFAMATPRSDELKGRTFRAAPGPARVRAASRPRSCGRRGLTPRRRERCVVSIAA